MSDGGFISLGPDDEGFDTIYETYATPAPIDPEYQALAREIGELADLTVGDVVALATGLLQLTGEDKEVWDGMSTTRAKLAVRLKPFLNEDVARERPLLYDVAMTVGTMLMRDEPMGLDVFQANGGRAMRRPDAGLRARRTGPTPVQRRRRKR